MRKKYNTVKILHKLRLQLDIIRYSQCEFIILFFTLIIKQNFLYHK